MGARYYDPMIGRFISPDPKLFDEQNPQLFNRYAYANNNPYRYVDPDGRSAAAVVEVVGGTLLAGAIYSRLSPEQQRAVLGAIGTLGNYTALGTLANLGSLIF